MYVYCLYPYQIQRVYRIGGMVLFHEYYLCDLSNCGGFWIFPCIRDILVSSSSPSKSCEGRKVICIKSILVFVSCNVCIHIHMNFNPHLADPFLKTCRRFQDIVAVQDFLIKLDIKPLMHLLQISTSSLNNVIVRLTKIANRADKNWSHFSK